MTKMTLSQELQWRGFVHQTSLSKLTDLDHKKTTFYHGYDASADSLTVGNLAAVMLDKCFVRHGHKAIILAGGATSMIGDPGGKDAERTLQPAETVKNNVASVKHQIERLFGSEVTMVNNLDWFKEMGLLEFLRDVGKHFSMTPLVQRDYIAKRLGEDGAGISYTEFSYTLLQGYDFLHLYREYGAQLQVAGSDQWGNAISGIDLVRRAEGQEVHALTCPLIVNKSTGKKFGKSEYGAIWLDPKKTSVYKFYQFWLNIDDDSVEDYLKIFTELGKESIDQIMLEFNSDRSLRAAQKSLTYEVTKLVHGEARADSVKRISEVLFGADSYKNLTDDDFKLMKEELPFRKFRLEHSLVDALVTTGLAESNRQARHFIDQGAIYVNGRQLKADGLLDKADVVSGHIVIRRGKNANAVLDLS